VEDVVIKPNKVNDRIAQTLRNVTQTMDDAHEHFTSADARLIAAQVKLLAGVCQEQQRRIEALEVEVTRGGRS
jgi:NAD-dependent SIR2 family protein deacetylase